MFLGLESRRQLTFTFVNNQRSLPPSQVKSTHCGNSAFETVEQIAVCADDQL